jgi:hypothetical protein
MKFFQTVVGSGDGVLSAVACRKRALPARATMIIVLVMSTSALAVGVTVAPAHAGDQRRCVSQREYRHVQVSSDGGRGWQQPRVADHFDIIGTQIRYDNIHGEVDTVWKYRKCSAWGPGGWYVAVHYDNYSSFGTGRRAWKKVPNRPYALSSWLDRDRDGSGSQRRDHLS